MIVHVLDMMRNRTGRQCKQCFTSDIEQDKQAGWVTTLANNSGLVEDYKYYVGRNYINQVYY